MAEPLADDTGILALYEGIIVATASAGLGEVSDVQLVEQFGNVVIDIFATVIGVETEDRKGEGAQHAFKLREQEVLGNILHGTDQLEPGYRVDQIDQVQPLDAIAITLVNRINAYVPWLSHRLRCLAQADGVVGGPGMVPDSALSAIG